MDIESTPKMVSDVYSKMSDSVKRYRESKGPLTLCEKILTGHLQEYTESLEGGKSYVYLNPDRVALQDVTGQMAILQFMQSGLSRISKPTTVHCDHLIQARVEGVSDTQQALDENSEVFKFLESSCRKYGIGFWKPGAGIIHQVVLENYAFPGGLMIGTDSHTPNAGGLGMLAIGVGGADAAEVMAGLSWELLYPKKIAVYLKGEMNGWTSPKDIILYVAGKLTVSGGTNAIVEYIGPGARTISCTGKATITNMGAEIGATCSVFPYDSKMEIYLRTTNRSELADIANQNKSLLEPDPEVEEDPSKYYDQVIEIDLSSLEPHVVGPHTPDLARPISHMSQAVKDNDYVDDISVALIGSCTNSSYEDMSRAASIAEQAKKMGIKSRVPLLVTPGSEQVRATIERDGQMESLKSIGATVLANACGPCIGQWRREEIKEGEKNTIVTSFNRNFAGRNDGKKSTMSFIGSPEMIVAFALSGKLSFNPLVDEIDSPNGKFKLDPPEKASEVPEKGFDNAKDVYVGPSDGSDVVVQIEGSSQRLQNLTPFSTWDGNDFEDLPLLLKAKGKCTTDHISPAGPWLRFRGHLDKISDNMFTGAVNAFTDDVGQGKNQVTGETDTFPAVARHYKENNLRWVVIGDNNYGEGSSREHAAMSPRHLGCAVVITRSFARIHETNLKKQGVLALTFENPDDYEKIKEDDKISVTGISNLSPGSKLKCEIVHNDGSKEEFILKHTYNKFQIDWFHHGSALNMLRNKEK